MELDSRYDEATVDDARSALYGAIGNVYNLQDKAHLAIHYYQLALPIFEKHNWLESQTVLYHNVGELYLLMGNIQEAERNFSMALDKGRESGDSLMVALSQKGLLKIYISQNKHAEALSMASPCYAFYHAHRTEEPSDYHVVLASLVRLNLMEGHKDIAAASQYVAEALLMADSLEFENRSDVYAAACELAMEQRQWQQALDYGLKTIHPDSLATSADASCYCLLAQIYAELGQSDKSREYVQKMYDVMARYATDHYQSGLSQMAVLYETEKKEAQIAALDRERSLYRWLLVAAVVAIMALIVGTILIVVVQRRKKALLAARVALETETKERSILARDLHDSLGGMLSVLRLKIEDYKTRLGQQGQPDEVLPLLDATHTELRHTAHHLMPEELLRNGLVSALNDFAVSVPGARFQAIGDIRLNKEQELVLYRCAYELVNNALKHADATHIDIQLMQDKHEVTLTVSDNGKGIQTPPLTPPLDGRGTAARDGMGLQNIRERIEPYHGTMSILSPEGQGTEINVTLPL